MEATTTGCQPHLVQGLLQIDDDLAAVGKGQGDHPAHALVVNVGIGRVIQSVTANLYASEHTLSLVHEFKVGHYNRSMLKVKKILVTALALVGCAVTLSACGQKGPLKMPNTPASAGRATLPQSLNPWHSPALREQGAAPSGKPAPDTSATPQHTETPSPAPFLTP
jgi:predicted small lipoprotein YifL